jgi:hypothetical protein
MSRKKFTVAGLNTVVRFWIQYAISYSTEKKAEGGKKRRKGDVGEHEGQKNRGKKKGGGQEVKRFRGGRRWSLRYLLPPW